MVRQRSKIMSSKDPSALPSSHNGAPLPFSRNAITPDAVATPDLSSQSVGALLRDARTRKGLSPGDLAQSLNLDLRIVELIEANRLDEAPEPIYVRAYLKHWAGLLDIDGAQLLAAFEAQRSINPRTDSVNTHARAPLDRAPQPSGTGRAPVGLACHRANCGRGAHGGGLSPSQRMAATH
ncbi:MAG: hypothetical protein B7Y58_05820 [Halothiobacillus sp. 35-54-62]|nr:MAG: hypothetical protein B7Y58_05820 [Halothiobacillus sp. 35-54-62]